MEVRCDNGFGGFRRGGRDGFRRKRPPTFGDIDNDGLRADGRDRSKVTGEVITGEDDFIARRYS